MTSLIDRFVAAKGQRKSVTNDVQVTRAEFNTLAKAVEILINDLEAATSPEKLQAALNSALQAAERQSGSAADAQNRRLRPPLALPGFKAPEGE